MYTVQAPHHTSSVIKNWRFTYGHSFGTTLTPKLAPINSNMCTASFSNNQVTKSGILVHLV